MGITLHQCQAAAQRQGLEQSSTQQASFVTGEMPKQPLFFRVKLVCVSGEAEVLRDGGEADSICAVCLSLKVFGLDWT